MAWGLAAVLFLWLQSLWFIPLTSRIPRGFDAASWRDGSHWTRTRMMYGGGPPFYSLVGQPFESIDALLGGPCRWRGPFRNGDKDWCYDIYSAPSHQEASMVCITTNGEIVTGHRFE